MDRRMDGSFDEELEGWIGGWVKEGWIGGWMDLWVEGGRDK